MLKLAKLGVKIDPCLLEGFMSSNLTSPKDVHKSLENEAIDNIEVSFFSLTGSKKMF